MGTRQITAAAVVAALCGLAPYAAQASTGDKAKIHYKKVYTVQDESARTLKDIEEQAYELSDHAVTIEAAAGVSSLSRQFYVEQMEAVKEDVNAMGKEIAHLEALASYETSAERRTVNRVKPQLKKVAATVEEHLSFLNERPGQLESAAYRDLAATLTRQTESLWKTLHDSVALSDLAQRQQKLRKDLTATAATQAQE
jgi:hypothetical protein